MLIKLLLLFVTTAVSCEMHETVQRMVMVRKSGSDLQPEATGFIYKSDTKGPSKLVKLEEGAVNDHLNSLPKTSYYKHPKSFGAPIPIAASSNIYSNKLKGEHSIPVVELADGDHLGNHMFDRLRPGYYSDYDGPARLYDYNGDYYGGGYGDYENGDDFDSDDGLEQLEEYIKGYKSDEYHDEGEKGSHGEAEEADKHEESEESDEGYLEADEDFDDEYTKGESYKGEDFGGANEFSNGVEVTGFHKVYNKNSFKKDHTFYDEANNGGDFNKYAKGEGEHGTVEAQHAESETNADGHEEQEFSKAEGVANGEVESDKVEISEDNDEEVSKVAEAGFEEYGAAGHGKEFQYEDY